MPSCPWVHTVSMLRRLEGLRLVSSNLVRHLLLPIKHLEDRHVERVPSPHPVPVFLVKLISLADPHHHAHELIAVARHVFASLETAPSRWNPMRRYQVQRFTLFRLELWPCVFVVVFLTNSPHQPQPSTRLETFQRIRRLTFLVKHLLSV